MSILKGKHKPRPSYVTFVSDEVWNKATLSERALFVARSQERMKVKEIGANWGPVVSTYLKVAGVFSPAPWCAAFVAWCLIEAGADRKRLPRFPASTFHWWSWAKETGRLDETHKRGRLFVWNGKGGGHIGFVLDDEIPFKTLEGNTNKTGSREGIEVAELSRYPKGLKKHPRWGFIMIHEDLYER